MERIILPNEYELEFRVLRFKDGQYGVYCSECERTWLLPHYGAVLVTMKNHRQEHFGYLKVS